MLIRNGNGLVSDALLGAIGGLLGGYFANALFGVPEAGSGLGFSSSTVAIVGALMVLGITRTILPSRISIQLRSR